MTNFPIFKSCREAYEQGKKDTILDMEGKSYYNLGKRDAEKLTAKEIEEIKQFCFNDGWDSGRIAILEEVQKQFRRKNYEWFAFRKWLEQQLKEAKGDLK